MLGAFVLLAWGALAFGAVYPWAYGPLLVGAGAIGATGLTLHARPAVPVSLLAGLLLVSAAISIQLVPLDPGTLTRVSPSTDAFLKEYDVSYRAAALVAALDATQKSAIQIASVRTTHPLSIAPSRTWLGLAFVVCLGTFFLGLIAVFSITPARPLAASLVTLGLVLALVGIIQKPFYSPDPVTGLVSDTAKIYGFWTPQLRGSNPFGPFVNGNHFAGWMIMALPLGLGYFCGRAGKAIGGVQSDWRQRVLWFSSTEANLLMLLAMALLLMSVSIVLTLSRAGIACFIVALALMGLWALAGLGRISRKLLAVAGFLLLSVIVISWVGVDTIAWRFLDTDWVHWNERREPWIDAMHIVRAFPLVGTGFNTYGVATLLYQTTRLQLHFAEAHNDFLQIVAEGGLLVAVPVAGTILLFVREVWRRFRAHADDPMTYWLRAGAVTGIVAIALQEVVDFSMQIPGNAVLFATLAALAVHRAPIPPTVVASESDRKRSRRTDSRHHSRRTLPTTRPASRPIRRGVTPASSEPPPSAHAVVGDPERLVDQRLAEA